MNGKTVYQRLEDLEKEDKENKKQINNLKKFELDLFETLTIKEIRRRFDGPGEIELLSKGCYSGKVFVCVRPCVDGKCEDPISFLEYEFRRRECEFVLGSKKPGPMQISEVDRLQDFNIFEHECGFSKDGTLIFAIVGNLKKGLSLDISCRVVGWKND